MTTPSAPKRARAWGAPPEPRDPYDDDGGRDEPPKRSARTTGSSGSFSPVTLALGLIALVFGFYEVARRWEWVDRALAANALRNDVRRTFDDLEQLGAGLPVEQVHAAMEQHLPQADVFLPLLLAGLLGIFAGVAFAAFGALTLLKRPIVLQLGSRGLVGALAVFVSSHVCDVWVGQRTIAHYERMLRIPDAGQASNPLQQAMASAYQRMVENAIPSLSDLVIDALLWVVPVALVALWGARHFEDLRRSRR